MDQLPAPSAVLFDLDGTLVDTVPTRIEAWMQALAEQDVAADRALVATMIGVDGRQLAREVAAQAGQSLDPDEAVKADARHGEIYAQLNTDPAPLPDVDAVVAALDSAGVPWAIATSSGDARQVRASMAALKFVSAPDVVDGSHVANAKPAPDLFLLAAQRLGVVDLAACWCVGDATWDIAAALAAGMVPIGVTAGSAVGASALTDAGARLVVPRLGDLLPLPAAAADGPGLRGG